MAVYGKTPLTKAVSKFAGDFNDDLQYELGLIYAPEATQLSALQNKMSESQSYDTNREQIMAKMIAADSGADSVESTALARMFGGYGGGDFPGGGPDSFPVEPAPSGPSEEELIAAIMNASLDPTTMMSSTPDMSQADPTIADRALTGLEGVFDYATDWPKQTPFSISPEAQASFRDWAADDSQYTLSYSPGVGDIVGDIAGKIANIPGNVGNFFSGMGDAALEFISDPDIMSQLATNQAGMAGPIRDPTIIREQENEELIQDIIASYPTWSTTEKILGITKILGKAYNDTGGGPKYDTTVNQLASYIGNSENDPTIRSAITDMVTNLKSDFSKSPVSQDDLRLGGPDPVDSVETPYYTHPDQYDSPVLPSYIKDRVTGTDGVTGPDGEKDVVSPWMESKLPAEVIKAISGNEDIQENIDGTTWLDWLSAVDSGKQNIYSVFKGDNPTFRMMNPRAEGLYDRWERQLRHQYNLELTNPNSPWSGEVPTGNNEQGAEIVNRNYREYLRAAFDPENRTANLWSRNDWQRNMEQVYANMGPGFVEEQIALGAKEGEEAVTQSRMLSGAFESFARDPEIVKQWIMAKSTKGANPIVARYAPQAIAREIDKWVMDNTKITQGIVSNDPVSQDAAGHEAAQSLFQEWAKRDFKWFGSKGYGRG